VGAVGDALFVLGGEICDDNGANNSNTSTVLKFNSIQSTWSQVAPMPEASFDHAALAVGNFIFVFGGEDDEGHRNSVYKYDTEADVWTTLTPMPYWAAGHSANLVNGIIYSVGSGRNSFGFVSYDPTLDTWSTHGPTVHSYWLGSSYVVNGVLHAVGGYNNASIVERYNEASDTWTAMANMLQGRRRFGTVTIRSTGLAADMDLFDSLIAQAARASLQI
jgi:N-acetylneuraminic acid mutarotase